MTEINFLIKAKLFWPSVMCLILTLIVSVANAGETVEYPAKNLSVDEHATTPTITVKETKAVTNEQPINSVSKNQISKQHILIKDILLVLDNSGSMKENDPNHLTKNAVKQFINNLDSHSRAGILIFDTDVRVAVPLSNISQSSKQQLLNSMNKIDYQGLYTDSPSAIEIAIYNLKNEARENAIKIIIFMTDGIVDTGNIERDLERAKWLKEYLAEDAADSEIKIFGIAFTENADFELIQSLAQKTGGEYYRVLSASALQDVFGKLNYLINNPIESEITEPKIKIIERIIEQPAPIPDPIVIEVPISKPHNELTAISYILILIIIGLVVAVFVMFLRKKKYTKLDNQVTAQEAYLNDIHGVTQQTTFALGSKPTMLGRVASKDTEQLNYFMIPETTIGRRHALIEYKDFCYWITDQGSINGTFINGKAVTSATRLKHTDIIRLHKIEFEFIVPEMNEDNLTVISSDIIPNKQAVDSEETLMPDSEYVNEDNHVTASKNKHS